MKKSYLFLFAMLIISATLFIITNDIGASMVVLATAPVVAVTKKEDEDEEVTMTKEQMTSLIENAMSKFAEDKGLLSLVKKNTPEELQRAEQERNPAYLFSKTLSCLYNHDKEEMQRLGIRSAKTEMKTKTTASMTESGSVFVPDATLNEIYRLIPTYGQGMSLFTQLPMGKNVKLKIPYNATGVTVSWVGEKSAIGASAPSESSLDLEVKKLAGIACIPNELLADANINIGEYLLSLFAEAFGIEYDKQFFQGDGTVFKGLMYDVAGAFGSAVTVANAGAIDYDDVVDTVHGVDQNYTANAVWLMNRLTLGKLRKIKDDLGLPIFFPANSGMPATLLEYPIKLIEQAPATAIGGGKKTAFAVLGDPKKSFIGSKLDMNVTLLTEATVGDYNLAEMDMSAIRVISRVAFNRGLTKSMSAIIEA